MFDEARRAEVRDALIDAAQRDDRIVAAAVTGSFARGGEDRWSDVDLFFGIDDGHRLDTVLDSWSREMYQRWDAIHHFDMRGGQAIYRAFLTTELLEVDLGFTRASAFGPLGGGEFTVLFGETTHRMHETPDLAHLVGYTWHHAAHARIAIERGKWWQAEHWITELRRNAVTLACARLALPIEHDKGADRLPASLQATARSAMVRELERTELARALAAATDFALDQLTPDDAATLREPLRVFSTMSEPL